MQEQAREAVPQDLHAREFDIESEDDLEDFDLGIPSITPSAACRQKLEAFTSDALRHLPVYLERRETASRDLLRRGWKNILFASKCDVSCHELERFLKSLPVPRCTNLVENGIAFAKLSMVDLLTQALGSRETASRVCWYPRIGSGVKEFVDTPHFLDLQERVAASSYFLRDGRQIFIHDIVTLSFPPVPGYGFGIIRNIVLDRDEARVKFLVFAAKEAPRGRLAGHNESPTYTQDADVTLDVFFDTNLRDTRASAYPSFLVDPEDVLEAFPPENVSLVDTFFANVPTAGTPAATPNTNPARRHRETPSLRQHPLTSLARRRREELMTLPVSFFSDETSGNKSKQGNFFETISINILSLPFSERQKVENNYVVTTANKVSYAGLARGITNDLVALERGFPAVDGETGRRILVVAPIAAFQGDNPRQSAFCSHQGTTARHPCRFCKFQQTDVPTTIGAPRDRLATLSAIQTLNRLAALNTDPKVLQRRQRELSVRRGDNPLLHLRWTDPHLHSPIELLHTILLGTTKYAVEYLFNEIRSREAAPRDHDHYVLAGIRDVNTRDCPHRLVPTDFIRKKGKLIGREFRVIAQYGCYMFRHFLVEDAVVVPRGRPARPSSDTDDSDLSNVVSSESEEDSSSEDSGAEVSQDSSDSETDSEMSLDEEEGPADTTVPQGSLAGPVLQNLTPLGKVWVLNSQLTRLLYTPEIEDMDAYCRSVNATAVNLIAAFAGLNDSPKRRLKLHLLMHLAGLAREMGPLRLYMSEVQERQNGDVRNRVQRTTRHNSSRHVLLRYALEHTVHNLEKGLLMKWGDGENYVPFPALTTPASRETVPQASIRASHRLQVFRQTSSLGNGVFSVGSLPEPFQVSEVREKLALQDHDQVILYNQADVGEKFKIVAGVSWVRLAGRSPGTFTIGKARCVISGKRSLSNLFCLVSEFRATSETDVFKNPVLEPLNAVILVPITSIESVVHVHHYCTANCKFVGPAMPSRGTRPPLETAAISIQHDTHQKKMVWNRFRWVD